MRTVLATLGLGFLGAAATAGVGAAIGPLAAGLAGGVAGNLATDLFKDFDRSVCERFLDGWSGIDENHHVVATLRLAQIDALRALLVNLQKARGNDDNRYEDQIGFRFSQKVEIFLNNELKIAQDRNFCVEDSDAEARKLVIALLPNTFDSALAARRASPEEVRGKSAIVHIKLIAEAAVLNELRTQCCDASNNIPSNFEDLFLGKTDKAGWFDLFVCDAADKLTHPASTFTAIWNAEQTALIKAYVEATNISSSASHRAIEELRKEYNFGLSILSSIERKLSEVHKVSLNTYDTLHNLKVNSSKSSNDTREIVSRVSIFMRQTLPTRLCSPIAKKGTDFITKELVDDLNKLRSLKFDMTDGQIEASENFVQLVILSVNKIIDAIKSEAKKQHPSLEFINHTLKVAVNDIESMGMSLCKMMRS